MTTLDIGLHRLACAAHACFDVHTLPTGGYRYTLRSGSPRWVEDLVDQVHHAVCMPRDDWRTEFIVTALGILGDADEPDDIEVIADEDVATLSAWLGSATWRYTRCDQALDKLAALRQLGANGQRGTCIVDILRGGQWDERNEVLVRVWGLLEDRIASMAP